MKPEKFNSKTLKLYPRNFTYFIHIYIIALKTPPDMKTVCQRT